MGQQKEQWPVPCRMGTEWLTLQQYMGKMDKQLVSTNLTKDECNEYARIQSHLFAFLLTHPPNLNTHTHAEFM